MCGSYYVQRHPKDDEEYDEHLGKLPTIILSRARSCLPAYRLYNTVDEYDYVAVGANPGFFYSSPLSNVQSLIGNLLGNFVKKLPSREEDKS